MPVTTCLEEPFYHNILCPYCDIKSAGKKGESTKSLKQQLKTAQQALDGKKAEVHELQEYKDLLVPGPMEDVTTIPSVEEDFANAVAGISENTEQMSK